MTTSESQRSAPAVDAMSLADVPIRPPRRTRTRASVIAILLVCAYALQSLVRNPAMHWHVVGHYLFSVDILKGIEVTLLLTFATMLLSLLIGGLLARMRISGSPVLRTISTAYVWTFRALPVLVVLVVFFNLALFYPHLTIGVPFGHAFISIRSQTVVTPMIAAIAAFTLNESAYASEILRASILAIDKGQWEAAAAIGMPRRRAFRRIILPQAIRIATPPLANDTINVLKGTALVAFIGVSDLLYSAQQIYQINFEVVPLLIVVTIWYVILVGILTGFQYMLERRMARKGIWAPRSRTVARIVERAT